MIVMVRASELVELYILSIFISSVLLLKESVALGYEKTQGKLHEMS